MIGRRYGIRIRTNSRSTAYLHQHELGAGYEKIDRSQLLPDLNLELLARCVLMAATSRVEAIREFRRGIAR